MAEQPPAIAENLPPLLTIDQLGELLQYHRKTIERLGRLGKIPGATKIGRSVRYKAAVILAWLEAGAPEQPGLKPAGRARKTPPA